MRARHHPIHRATASPKLQIKGIRVRPLHENFRANRCRRWRTRRWPGPNRGYGST